MTGPATRPGARRLSRWLVAAVVVAWFPGVAMARHVHRRAQPAAPAFTPVPARSASSGRASLGPVPPERVSPAARPVLVTNEYAYRHPTAPDATRSAEWVVTSGSLFRLGDALWSGDPDDRAPDADSATGTDSAVLRAVSTGTGYRDVRVSFALRVHRLVTTDRTPARTYDGVHVFLRYLSERSTYTVSVYRRDHQVVIKKKLPGGPSAGGTYTTLATGLPGSSAARRSAWEHIDITVSSAGRSGGVRFTVRVDGRLEIDAVDSGTGGRPITDAGRVGLRGDNCDFLVRDFRVEPLS